MKKIKFTIAILLLLAISCKQETATNSLIHINIDPDKVEEIYDIAGDVENEWEIIPLETTDECLVAQISKIVFQNGKYYVLDRQSVIHVFDASGKFLRKLDKKGEGPGEYRDIASFDVIGNDVLISEAYKRRLFIYDSLFNYKSMVEADQMTVLDINHVGQNIYLASNWYGFREKNVRWRDFPCTTKNSTVCWNSQV